MIPRFASDPPTEDGSRTPIISCSRGAAQREINIAPVSAHTFRLTVSAPGQQVPDDGCLVQQTWGAPVAKLRGDSKAQTVKAGGAAIPAK